MDGVKNVLAGRSTAQQAITLQNRTVSVVGMISINLMITLSCALATGFVQAAAPLEIPIEVTAISIEQPRREEFRNVPHGQAAAVLAAEKEAGGACHEIVAENTVVCVYQKRQIGIDWQKLYTEMNTQPVTKR